MDDETAAVLKTRTESLRSAAVAKHVGSMPQRIQEPLADILEMFVFEHPAGVIGTYAYDSGVTGLPPLPPGYADDKDFLVFAWAGALCAMLQKAMQSEVGRVQPDVSGALNALDDRMSVFAYEPWRSDGADPRALLSRLDQIASAYSVGAAIAWAGITKNAPKDVQRIRRLLGMVQPEQRFLLTKRYGERVPLDQLTKRLKLAPHEVGFEIAAILESIRAEAPS